MGADKLDYAARGVWCRPVFSMQIRRVEHQPRDPPSIPCGIGYADWGTIDPAREIKLVQAEVINDGSQVGEVGL